MVGSIEDISTAQQLNNGPEPRKKPAVKPLKKAVNAVKKNKCNSDQICNCFVCDENYYENTNGEEWIRCSGGTLVGGSICQVWAHEKCGGSEFYCDKCITLLLNP